MQQDLTRNDRSLPVPQNKVSSLEVSLGRISWRNNSAGGDFIVVHRRVAEERIYFCHRVIKSPWGHVYVDGNTLRVQSGVTVSTCVAFQRHFSWCTLPEGALLPDKGVNNSGAIQIAVVVPPPYLQYIFRQSSTQALRWRVCYIQILKVLIFWRRYFEGGAFWKHFSYSKAAQYLMPSTGGCVASIRKCR